MCHPLLVGLNKSSTAKALAQPFAILDLHVDLVGGEVQKNILSILLWASAVVGELHCLIIQLRIFRAGLHGAFTTPGLNSALLNGLKILTIT